VAKQKKQTNSNLLGIILAAAITGRREQSPGLIFFRVGPPVKSQAPSFKPASSQALTGSKLWDIIGIKKRKEKMKMETTCKLMTLIKKVMQLKDDQYIEDLTFQVMEEIDKQNESRKE
jgi:hypothetical protein